jgi:hypothetical protein
LAFPLFSTKSWTSNQSRLQRAGVPAEYQPHGRSQSWLCLVFLIELLLNSYELTALELGDLDFQRKQTPSSAGFDFAFQPALDR